MLSILKGISKQIQRRTISFSQLGVNSLLVKQLEKQHISEATSIQEKAIPLEMRGCSPIMISSETGSGKTLAYLIPYLESYLKNPYERMFIYVPQRELAYQINTVLHRLVPEIKSSILTSGSEGISQGKVPNVVIGTPPLLDEFIFNMFSKADPSLLQSKQRTVSYVVYDEADMILTQKLNKSRTIQSLHILQHHNENMQVVVVGATLPRNGRRTIGGMIDRLFPSVYWCESTFASHIPPSIHIDFKQVNTLDDKQQELKTLIPVIKKKDSLIFVNSEHSLESVAYILSQSSIPYQVLSKKLESETRRQAMKNLSRKGNQPLCTICGGLGARGLDTTGIDVVVNYDFPNDIRQFIHRCGRTGRCERDGEVICFVSPTDRVLYESIMRIGVYNDLSQLYSRHRTLNRKYKQLEKKKAK